MSLSDSKLTYEDFLHFPENDGLRHELIGGEHFMWSAPGRRHQSAVGGLSYFFLDFLRRSRLGHVYHGPFDVVLSNEDVVEPDLIFISNERAGILNEENARGTPDLIIEVLSEETRKIDETLKLDLYDRAGVDEYWLIDPGPKTARLYRRDGARLVLARSLSGAAGDILDTPLLPGLAIPLAEVFQ